VGEDIADICSGGAGLEEGVDGHEMRVCDREIGDQKIGDREIGDGVLVRVSDDPGDSRKHRDFRGGRAWA